MTYGLYTPDFGAYALKGVSLEVARAAKQGDLVVCSERERAYGFSFEVHWQKQWYLRVRSWCLEIGPLTFIWGVLRAKWADKIVEDAVNAMPQHS